MKTLLEDRRFYVYVYLDPRKPGQFKYDEFSFDFEPFYVGKGKEERYIQHLLNACKDENRKKNSRLFSKIRKIKLTIDPKIIKIKDCLTEKQAFDLEKKIIDLIGRKNIGGPLFNIAPGGEGTSKVSQITRDKLATKSKNHRHSEKTKDKMSKMKKGKTYEEIYKDGESKRKNHSEQMMGKNNPFFGKDFSDETKEKMRKTKEETFKNMTAEERKQKMGQSRGKKLYRNNKTNEIKMLLSKDVTSDWTPAKRTFSESHKQAISNGKKTKFKEWNKQKKIDKNLKYRTNSKEFKEQMSESIKIWWQKRKLQQGVS
jgi:hypothetical protein